MTINEAQLRYDLAVFIGRFQIFHNGHLHVIEEALQKARTVLIIIGSANEARKPDRLPFTADERREMIINSISDTKYQWRSVTETEKTVYAQSIDISDRERVFIKYAEDFSNMTLWTEQIQRLVEETVNNLTDSRLFEKAKITLIGHAKDNSSFYLKAFPQWDSINVEQKHILSATDIRNDYFKDWNNIDEYWNRWYTYVVPTIPKGTLSFLNKFRSTEFYTEICKELRFMETYLAQWDSVPYKPNFLTVDNVVIQSGFILLIQRKSYPGKDLWALPGGHLEQDETVEQGTLRELREETKLKVPESVLKGSIVATKYFDNPYRSTRRRTLTFATLFHLNPKVPERILSVKTDGTPNTFSETEEAYRKRVKEALRLPRVTAADDAKKAKWVRLDEIRRDQMMEDHFSIIQTMKAMIKED
jgi:bifunctional NMN adenylyltransferase/nudix hydrolase